MSWTFILSILLCLAALIWAVALARRLRDRRVGFLAGLIAVSLGHHVYALVFAGGNREPTSAPYGIVVLLAIYVLQRAFSERDQGRAALRQSEAKLLATALRSSPDSIMILSLDDDRLVDVNEGFETHSGYRRQQAVGRTSEELEVWADPEQRRLLLADLEERQEFRNLEIDFRTRSGDVRSTLISGAVIEIDGRPHLLAQIRDVTERKQAAEMRENLLNELRAKHDELKVKNEGLKRFITLIYDQCEVLTDPLVTVTGFLGLLKKDIAAGDAERVERDIERIHSAAKRIRQLHVDLIELGRIDRSLNSPETFPLTDAAREAAGRIAERLAERGIAVDIAEDMPAIVADRPRILQVLHHLIDNAAKFIDDDDDSKIEVGAREVGDEVVCFVRDNGIGIDPQFHKRIFGVFERMDTAYDGTGVGLAVIERIMEVHEGRVWVESEGKGCGSTFYFALPRQRAG